MDLIKQQKTIKRKNFDFLLIAFFFILFIKSSNDTEFKILMNSIYGIVLVTKNILLCLSISANENIEETSDELHLPSGIDLDEFSLINLKNR